MGLPKEYLSPSQINLFLKCPFAYKTRYIDNIIERPNIKMVQGSAVHKGNEFNYLQKIDSRTDLNLNTVKEYTAAAFEEIVSEVEDTPQEKGKGKDNSVKLVTLYHQEVAPEVQPIAVEQKIEVEFENVPYKLLLIPDVITEDGFIRDTKTTGRTPGLDMIQQVTELQLTAYAIGYEHKYGKKPRGVGIDYLINTKVPKAVKADTNHVNNERFLKIMQYVATSIEQELFYPNFASSQCSYCGFRKYCTKW